MKCPACGQENRAGRKFCAVCGAALALACAACGAQNEPGERFCGECGKPLGQALPATPDSASASAPAPSPAPAAVPTSFVNGRYRVERFLGEGGKKRVYLAHDARLDRRVAFSLIKAEGLDAEGLARIQREAQAMGRLGDHPHIVSVFDIGEENGQPYLVSQLMGGGDVEGLIENAEAHRLPLAHALRIAGEVCRALEYAHAHGVVHRDLKPGNVWLTAEGTAKLGDFGLAVALDRSRLTQAGMMVGTVAYMPPEQAVGGAVEPRSDLYSLGAMLYELVTGRPPFLGEESVAIITQHLNTPPVVPTWHRPDLPPALETLILRLLEKDPAKRPASASEVRQALAAIDLATPRDSEPAAQSAVPNPQSATGIGPLYRQTFVGREAELGQLRAAFDRALSGQGGLTMVVGEPGIGKTALCGQLATYVTIRGGRALVGHAYEEGSLSLPYLAFVEAIRGYVLERPADALRSELGSGAAEVARIVSEVREHVAVEPRAASDPEEDRWRLLQAVSGFLRNAGTVQPLLLVLEDLHWADRGTLDLLNHLARNLAGARLLVVGTYRDVEVDRAHPLSGALAELRRASSFGRLLLRGLSVEETLRLLSGIANQDITWGFAEAVHRQTEGNPLFVQEVVRFLVEEGLVTREDGLWRQTSSTPLAMSIPEGLREVIGRRLSRLGPECNRLLAIAAVIGRDFDLATLQAVAGIDEEPLTEALEEALRLAILQEQSRPGSIRYRFAHAFFRQTLYEEMSAPRRLRLHQQVARALESQYAARLDDHAEELAEHFAQSTDPADLAKAVHYGELAAQRALAVFAYGEAVRHLDRALEVQEILEPEDKTKRIDLLLALGEALTPAGEAKRASEEAAERAFVLAEAAHDRERAALACRIALFGLIRFGGISIVNSPAGSRWVDRADAYAPPDSLARVLADNMLGRRHYARGEYSEQRVLEQRALTLARKLNEPMALYLALLGRLALPGGVRHERERLELAEEISRQPRQGIPATWVAVTLNACSHMFLEWGQRDRCEAFLTENEALVERVREQGFEFQNRSLRVILLALDGQLEAALFAARELIAVTGEAGAPGQAHTFGNFASFTALFYLGRADEALAVVPAAAAATGSPELPIDRVVRAQCLAHLGRKGEAQALLQQLLKERGIGPEEDETGAQLLARLLETAVLVQDREVATMLSKRLAILADRSLVYFEYTCPARHLGAAAMLNGDRVAAKAFYTLALEAAARVRHRPETALIRLQLAELLLEEAAEEHDPARNTEALEHLDFAIAELRAMKMQPALARALGHKGLLKA